MSVYGQGGGGGVRYRYDVGCYFSLYTVNEAPLHTAFHYHPPIVLI